MKSSELSQDELSRGKIPPEWRSPRCSSASSKCGFPLLKTLRCNGVFFRLLSCLFLFVSREERQCSPRYLQRISGSARCEFWRGPKEFFEGCDLGAARSSRSVEEGAKPDAGLWAVCFLFNENTSGFLHSHSLRGFQPRRIHWANVKIFCDKTKGVAICAGNICIYHKNNYLCEQCTKRPSDIKGFVPL